MSVADHNDTSLPQVDWPSIYNGMFAAAADHLVETRQLPIALAEALDDIGEAFKRAAVRIMLARESLGLPLPAGPDDEPDAE